jgi:hypothetical protein
MDAYWYNVKDHDIVEKTMKNGCGISQFIRARKAAG